MPALGTWCFQSHHPGVQFTLFLSLARTQAYSHTASEPTSWFVAFITGVSHGTGHYLVLRGLFERLRSAEHGKRRSLPSLLKPGLRFPVPSTTSRPCRSCVWLYTRLTHAVRLRNTCFTPALHHTWSLEWSTSGPCMGYSAATVEGRKTRTWAGARAWLSRQGESRTARRGLLHGRA